MYYCVWSGCDLGVHSMFFFLCFCISLFWPGMVLNQGQLSIVVSDWEPYLGSFFPQGFCGLLFSVSVPYGTVSVSFILLLFCNSVQVNKQT